ncbi:hypothetical protein H4R19_003888, partial [Coemansia spiralis]
MLLKSCAVLGLAATALAASGVAAPEAKAESGPLASRSNPAPSRPLPRAAPAPVPQPRAAPPPPPLPPIQGSRKKRRTRRTTSSAFNPNDIDIGVKVTWCNDNTNFCQNVCLNKTWGSPINDGCDADTLNWHCTCGN